MQAEEWGEEAMPQAYLEALVMLSMAERAMLLQSSNSKDFAKESLFPRTYCAKCNVGLCIQCFAPYHKK